MLCALRSSRSACLLAVLCGPVLIAPLLGTALSPTPSPAKTPTAVQQEAPARDSAADASAQSRPTASDDESVAESVLETLIGAIILGPIIAIIMGLLLAFPTVLLGVSLVMEGGCLRYILFGMGWLSSIFYGMLSGLIIGEAVLGLEFLVKPIIYVFMWGYPVAGYWGYRKLDAMPEEQYQAWDQTLTGGALLGFGAGSIAGVLRSAASGFGGFGGGSFGGGGASGSWSGASGAAGSAASTSAGGASSAAGTTTAAAGGASEAAAVATAAAPGVADSPSPSASPNGSESRGFGGRLRRWFRKFQWYHGLVFILATLVFVPLGLGMMQALQNTKFFVFTLVAVVVYSGYKLLRRFPNAPDAVASKISSFRGGEASSSWS